MWEVGVGWWVGGIYSNNWGHGDSEEPMWGHTHTHTFTIASVAMIISPINQDYLSPNVFLFFKLILLY